VSGPWRPVATPAVTSSYPSQSTSCSISLSVESNARPSLPLVLKAFLVNLVGFGSRQRAAPPFVF
jgi:hypothetical protein